MLTTQEKNKRLFYSFVEAWNSRDFAAMMQCWSPQLVHHHRNGDYGRDDVYSLMAGFMEAFPDLRFEVQNVVAEGEYVSAHMRARATHNREFAGVPATGREVTATVMGLVRIIDESIVEHWNVMDEIHLMHQLGLLPDQFLLALAPA